MFPSTAPASFNGPMELGFGFVFAVSAVLALPGGVLCAVAEVLGTRHRPPLWIGFAAVSLATCSLLVALRVIGPGGDSGWFVFPIPPLMTLALVAFFPAPRWRLAAVWGVAVGVGLLLAVYGMPRVSAATTAESLGALFGGGLGSMLPWQLAFILQQRARRRAGIEPPQAPWCASLLRRLLGSGHWASPDHSARPGRLNDRQRGLLWWLGGAILFYLGVLALTALGSAWLMSALLAIEWRIADLFGLAVPSVGTITPAGWWVSGLIWAAIAGGGVWGLAASTGRFDPGRLAPLRLLAIVLALAMLAGIMVVS